MATLPENRRGAGKSRNPVRVKKEGAYRGGEGTTPVTTAFVQKIAESKPTSYELSWKVKVMKKNKTRTHTFCLSEEIAEGKTTYQARVKAGK